MRSLSRPHTDGCRGPRHGCRFCGPRWAAGETTRDQGRCRRAWCDRVAASCSKRGKFTREGSADAYGTGNGLW